MNGQSIRDSIDSESNHNFQLKKLEETAPITAIKSRDKKNNIEPRTFSNEPLKGNILPSVVGQKRFSKPNTSNCSALN